MELRQIKPNEKVKMSTCLRYHFLTQEGKRRKQTHNRLAFMVLATDNPFRTAQWREHFGVFAPAGMDRLAFLATVRPTQSGL
jgi:hypothetical protein